MIDIEMVEKMNDRIAILEDTIKVLNEVVSSLAQSLNGLQNSYMALSAYVATIPNTEVLFTEEVRKLKANEALLTARLDNISAMVVEIDKRGE